MDEREDVIDTATNDSAVGEFLRITNDFARAIRTNEAPQIAEFLSEEWVLVTPEVGPVTRQQFLKAIADGRLRHETMELEVVRAKTYGDIALVTGRGKNTGTFNGSPIKADEWTTDVYHRVGGRWRCVLTQLTPVSDIGA